VYILNNSFLSFLMMGLLVVSTQQALSNSITSPANKVTNNATSLPLELIQTLNHPYPSGEIESLFGKNIAAFENTLVVGDAVLGEVYIYSRTNSHWQLSQSIRDGVNGSRFGSTITLFNDFLAISDINGQVFVYQKLNDNWEYSQTISSPFERHGNFGESIAMNNNTLIIGAPRYHGGSPSTPPSIYIYEKTEDTWLQTQIIHSDVPEPEVGEWGNEIVVATKFGTSLALAGSSLVVGDPEISEDTVGAVSMFVNQNNQWEFVQKIDNHVSASYSAFGESVALSNNTLAIAAPIAKEGTSSPTRGAVYLFDLSIDQHWQMTETLSVDQPTGLINNFGKKILFFNEFLVVTDPNSGYFSYGTVHTFARSNNSNSWLLTNNLTLAEPHTGFGSNLATDGNHLFITPEPGLALDNKVFIFGVAELPETND
jgi:FG-GAP repeat